MPLTKIKSLGITDGAVTIADLAATGTPSATTFLRGDNSWGSAGATAGQVIQVVSAVDSTQRSTSSTSFVTGSNALSVSITPSSSSNKIFIMATHTAYDNDGDGFYTIYRGSTNLGTSNGMGNIYSGGTGSSGVVAMSYLDSPATTSSTTYQVYIRHGGAGTVYMNYNSCRGSITVFEIKG